MQIRPFLTQWLTRTCQLTDFDVFPLAGDASFRRYFRIQQANRSFILMDAQAEKKSCEPFVAIAHALRSQGILCPEIIASDLEQGTLLLTDFGDLTLLGGVNKANALQWYKKALDVLCQMQQCKKVEGWDLALFTEELMHNELQLFREWFLEKYLGLKLSHVTLTKLHACFVFIAQECAKQPSVFMHRDYHSANLMLVKNNEIGVLDFQDAFQGPVTYDVVSLLRDCYIAWPEQWVAQLLEYYWHKLALPGVSLMQFTYWFDLMGIQRHLKALLTFSRKYCRDHNEGYLQHIPRTLQYILTTSARYPECHFLHQFLMTVTSELCAE